MSNKSNLLLTRRALRRKGFTLTEMAIATGLIGAILSAIWVAANTVQDKNKLQYTVQQIGEISQRVREVYMNAFMIKLPVADGVDATKALDLKGVFPAAMRASCSGCSGTSFKINHIYGSFPNYGAGLGGGSFRVVVPGGNSNNFQIILMGVPASACINLLISGVNYRDQTNGINGICASTSAAHSCYTQSSWQTVGCSNSICNRLVGGVPTALTVAQAQTLCGTGTSEVGFQYDIRR